MIESNFEFDSINWPTSEPYWVVLDKKGRECSDYFHHYYEARHALKYKCPNGASVVQRKITY